MTYREALKMRLEQTDALTDKQKKLFISYARLRNDCQCPDCGEISEVLSVEAKELQGFGMRFLGEMTNLSQPSGRVYACLSCGSVFTTRV